MGFLGDLFFNYGSWVLTPVHVLVCLILIAVVLMQAGKGADFAGAFGGGGTQTAFGPRGVENTLSRMTKLAAVMFMVSSLGLSLVGSKASRGSGLKKELDLPSKQEVLEEQKQKQPAVTTEPTALPIVVPATDAAFPIVPDAGSEPPADALAKPDAPDASTEPKQP